MERIAFSMPAPSMLARRMSPKSVRAAWILSKMGLGTSVMVGCQYSISPGEMKCSSSAIFFMAFFPGQ